MSEAGGSNVEVAHHLREHKGSSQSLGRNIGDRGGRGARRSRCHHAWSGYQAALWTGHQAEPYGHASKLRIGAMARPWWLQEYRMRLLLRE
jgi:hypothetical protein